MASGAAVAAATAAAAVAATHGADVELMAPAGPRLITSMRAVLGDDSSQVCVEGSVHAVVLGPSPSVHVSRLFLALHSPTLAAAIFLDPAGAFSDVQARASTSAKIALEKLRDLVHTGTASFGGDKASFFEVFRLADVLDLPECYEALSAAAGVRSSDLTVQLSEGHAWRLAGRLGELYRATPRSSGLPPPPGLAAGLFDTSLVLSSAEQDTLSAASLSTAPPSAMAHRLVLTAASAHLRELSELQRDAPWRLEFPSEAKNVLDAFLDFAYIGKATIPRFRFKELALRADAWRFDSLGRACVEAVVAYDELAALLMEDTLSLPDVMLVATSTRIPVMVEDGDIDAFVRYVRNPIIACHLSRSMIERTDEEASLPPPMAATNAMFGWRVYRTEAVRASYGEGHLKGDEEFAELLRRLPVGSQLERFILSDHFLEFLARPEVAAIPLWS